MTAVQTAGPEFMRLARESSLPLDEPVEVVPGVCVLRLVDDVMTFRNVCPHRGHPLSEGACVGGKLRCALHGWEFAIPQGEAVSPRSPFALKQFETRVVDGWVEAAL